MKLDELLEELKKLENSGDPEEAHARADDLLLVYIDNKKVTEAFENVPRWYA